MQRVHISGSSTQADDPHCTKLRFSNEDALRVSRMIGSDMARVEQAIHDNLDTGIRVFAILPKDRVERVDYWERRYLVCFERRHNANSARPMPVDYGSITVCIDSAGENLCVDGWYDRTTPTQALQDALARTNLHGVIV